MEERGPDCMTWKDYLQFIGISLYDYETLSIEDQIKIYDTYRLKKATDEINDIYEEREGITCQQEEN